VNIRKELIEGITQELIKFLCEDEDYSIDQAMEIVYNSKIFEKISDVETGLYKESPSFIYELLKDELNDGFIIQKEQ
jgi:DNA-binding PadR family transcriptional regulator